MKLVDRDKLEAVALMKPSFLASDKSLLGPVRNGHKEFDLEGWMMTYNIPVKRQDPWQRHGYRWVLAECPWNGHTDNAAYIVRFAGGAVAAGCHHNSCQGLGWRDF